jgi:TolB protein
MVRTLFHFVLAAMLLTSSLGTALAQERVYIDIDSPSFQKFPVAVTDFNRLSPPSGEDLTVWFSGTLSSYLNMTGYIISKSAFLETPAPPPQGYETINYPNWSVIGAEYLVRGTYRQSASQLSVEMRLYDVVKGQQLHGARYTGRTEDRIAIVRKMAGDILQVLTGDGRIFGTRIAYVAKKGKNTELRTILFDGTSQTEVTAFQSLTLAPRWSPDGRYLSFTSYKDGNPNFYIRDMRSGAVREASRRPGLNLSGAWSPDGRELLLTLSFEGNQEIYRMDVSSGQIKRLTFNHDIDVSPAWSPDGKQIVFVSNRSGSPQIYIMDRDGPTPNA